MRTERPSATAALVARGVALIARDPELAHLVPPLAGEVSAWCLETASPRARQLLRALDHGWFRSAARALEQRVLPGITLHYVLRKRFLEDLARESIEDGARQVVVLGAGYDALALALHLEHPEVIFVEIDHPATQRVKRKALQGRRGLPRPNLHFVPADLSRRTIEGCLAACRGFDPAADTLFIAEGLLMYLAPGEVEALLRGIRNRGGARSRVAFTFMERQPDGRPGFRTASRGVDLWLRLRGEPFRWGVSWEGLPGFLERGGLRLREVAGSETLRHRYLAGTRRSLPLPEGEAVCVAEFAPARRTKSNPAQLRVQVGA